MRTLWRSPCIRGGSRSDRVGGARFGPVEGSAASAFDLVRRGRRRGGPWVLTPVRCRRDGARSCVLYSRRSPVRYFGFGGTPRRLRRGLEHQARTSPKRRFLSCRRCPPCVSTRPTKMGKSPKKCMPRHATALNLCLTHLLPEARSRATTTRRPPNDTRTRVETDDRTSAHNRHCASA